MPCVRAWHARRLKVAPGRPMRDRVDRLVLPENALERGLPGAPCRRTGPRRRRPSRRLRRRHARAPARLAGPRAVRRFHCARCAAAFETSRVEEIELDLDARGARVPAEDPLEAFVRSARRTVPRRRSRVEPRAGRLGLRHDRGAGVRARRAGQAMSRVEPEPAAPAPPKRRRSRSAKLPSLPKRPEALRPKPAIDQPADAEAPGAAEARPPEARPREPQLEAAQPPARGGRW